MRSLESDPHVRSVKLFPRLAMNSPSTRRVRVARVGARARRRSGVDQGNGETPHSQMRARLLQMILENERVRRHEQRPSAS